jgi:hypothetical protein
MTPPALPVEAGALAVESTIRNGSTVTLDVSVTVGFLRAGQLVAIADGQVRALTAGSSAPATLYLSGDVGGATETIEQVDFAIEVP